MGQFGFFDTEKRLAALSAKGDPLEAADRLVPWESFRADIEGVVLTPDQVKKSSAGRKGGERDEKLVATVMHAHKNKIRPRASNFN